MRYNSQYYYSNKQYHDRIALQFYYRIARSFVREGMVLDYGCGTGHLIKRFQNGYEAWGYDVSTDALAVARQNAPGAKLSSDFEVLKFNKFDLIITIHVLEHIDQPMETFRLFNSILKDGGVLVYAVPNISGLGHKLKKHNWFGYGDPTHVSLLSQETWLNVTKESGLAILKTGTDGLWAIPYFRFVPKAIEMLLFYPLPALQIMLGKLFIPMRWGESLIVIAKKSRR